MTVNTNAASRDGVQDRRRAREERGLASAGASARGDRLPPAPRERRPLLAALAVILIVGGSAAAGLLAVRSDSRLPVLVAARSIAVGEQITADALATTPVASEGTLLIPASQQELVIGQYARISVSEGQLLDSSMLTSSGMLHSGAVAVGASLAVGRFPASGLQAGDIVQLVAVADGQGQVIVTDALVSSVYAPGSTSTGSSGAATATFIVEAAKGAQVAAIAADGGLAVVLVSRGEAVGDGES